MIGQTKTRRLWGMVGLASALAMTLLGGSAHAQTRDPWLWPFSQDSIWNMPIGSNASYVNAGFGELGWLDTDREFLKQTNASDPVRIDTSLNGNPFQQSANLHLPDDYLIPGGLSNNGAAFLDTDGRTLKQFSPFIRDTYGSDFSGNYDFEFETLTGTGYYGGHFGSKLSVLGGSLRLGELTGSAPIHHAIKIELDFIDLYRNSSSGNNRQETYRWPAKQSDGEALGSSRSLGYTGTNPALRMGSLLAIRPDVSEGSLGLTTDAAKKIFHALQDYGGYVVDTSGDHYVRDHGGYTWLVCMEYGAETEFQNAYGYGFGGSGGAFYNDMNAIYKSLAVVDNNGPDSIGGGGTPRQPLAPPFGLADGNYRLINRSTGNALHGTGDTYAGISGAYYCVTTPASWNASDQIWHIQPTGDGSYRLINQVTGAALQGTADPYGNLSGVFYAATTPASWNGSDQKWAITPNSDGYDTLVCQGSGTPGATALQETGETYGGFSNVFYVAVTPTAWNSNGQQWTLVKQ